MRGPPCSPGGRGGRGTLSGSVIDLDGLAVEDAVVKLGTWVSGRKRYLEARSNERGEFQFSVTTPETSTTLYVETTAAEAKGGDPDRTLLAREAPHVVELSYPAHPVSWQRRVAANIRRMRNPISIADRCYFWSRTATFGGTVLLASSIPPLGSANNASFATLIAGSVLVGAGLISSAILATAASVRCTSEAGAVQSGEKN